jgi:phage shock protein E
MKHVTDVTPRDLVKQGALVIDVRSADEWNTGHLPQAKHLPLGELQKRLDDVEEWTGGDKKRVIVVHCASGGRSARARVALMAAGYENVVNGVSLENLR